MIGMKNEMKLRFASNSQIFIANLQLVNIINIDERDLIIF